MGVGNQRKELGRNILFQLLAAAGGSPVPCDYEMVVVFVVVAVVEPKITSTATTTMKNNLLWICRVRRSAARILRRNGRQQVRWGLPAVQLAPNFGYSLDTDKT